MNPAEGVYHVEVQGQSRATAEALDDFPLYAHASGRWAKRVKGTICYFGLWRDDRNGQRALQTWIDQRDDLLAGRKPRRPGDPDSATIKELCDAFLTAKEALVSVDGEEHAIGQAVLVLVSGGTPGTTYTLSCKATGTPTGTYQLLGTLIVEDDPET